MSLDTRPPFFHRLETRITIGAAICFVIGSFVLIPIWDWLGGYFHSPMENPKWYQGWSLLEFVTMGSSFLCVGLLLGGTLGALISRVSMARLNAIAAQASVPIAKFGTLPGPFPVEGQDEISQLARALNHMRDRATGVMADLSQREAARTEWVALVSHDLRTPLAALTTSLDLVERRIQQGKFDDLEKHVTAAQADTDRVTSLSMDLLEIARLEVNPSLTLEPVDPREVAEHALNSIAPLASKHAIKTSVTCAPGACGEGSKSIEADGQLLLRALTNLLINSIQHADAKVNLHISCPEKVGVQSVRFTVTDDGPGLPEVNGIVNYAELKNQRSRADSSGLGLIVAARVAELHGGSANATNPRGGGAAVWFDVVTAMQS